MHAEKFERVRARLRDGVVIGDGALGTRLQGLAGIEAPLPEMLNMDQVARGLIRGIHEGDLRAGAVLLETNTFAANPLKLGPCGLADRCEEVNAAAVAIARLAGSDAVLVAGSVGPLDLSLTGAEGGEPSLIELYGRQMGALSAAGVDLLFLETFSSVVEVRAALDAAAATGLPVFFSMGGQSLCRRYSQPVVEALIEECRRDFILAVGFNCVSPYDLSRLLPVLVARTDKPLLAYPNAGIPSVIRGRVQYDLPVAGLISEAENWYRQGVTVFGGCCGTDSDHIRALSERFGGRPAARRATPGVVVSERRAPPPATPFLRDPDNPVRRRLHGPKPVIALEVNPTLSRPLPVLVQSLEPVVEAGPDLFSVPDSAGANPARDCMACAHLLQQRYPVPAIIHKTPTQTNALHLHAYLLGAADLGIRGLLAVSGDSPSIGPFDRLASRVMDVRNSVELLRIVSGLRAGVLGNGQPLPTPVDFACGGVLTPSPNLSGQTKWLHRKREAGAEFIFTQPVFLAEDLVHVQEGLAGFPLPVFFGIFPLASLKQAQFLQSGKVPGIVIPEGVGRRMGASSRPEDQKRAGMDIVLELIERTASRVDGYYLVMPFHRDAAAMTVDIIRAIRACRQTSEALRDKRPL